MTNFKKHWRNTLSFNRKKIKISVLNTIILMALNYCLSNISTIFSDSSLKFTWTELIKNDIHKSALADNPLFINVSYDKQLIEFCDDFGFPKGNIAITDRQKLHHLLLILQSLDNYKYIFLDVHFQKDFTSPHDSALFSTIANMERIVIAGHPYMALTDTSIAHKSAISGYTTSILKNDFSHYRYLWSGKESMPAFAYRELKQRNIQSIGPLFFDKISLCRNFQFLNFPFHDFSEYTNDGNKQFYQLGTDLLDQYSINDFKTLAENRYIVIGDYIEDIHNTYAGVQPGPVILYQAFQSLMQEKHIVKIETVLFQFILYFIVSFSLISKFTITERLKNKNIALRIIGSMLGYTIVLTSFSLLCFIIWEINIEIILPICIFSIEKTILTHKHSER